MNLRAANDLLLTELIRRITNEWAETGAMLTSGDLSGATKKAREMDLNLLGFIHRLYDIRFPDEANPHR